MGKYATYLDLGEIRIDEQKLDFFPFLDPTFQYSSTPILIICTTTKLFNEDFSLSV